MEEPASWLPSLGAFARRGTDLRVFHVFDEREWTLDFNTPSVFFSPEGGDEIPVDPGGAQGTFAEVVDEYVREVRTGVIRWGGVYRQIATRRPLEELLREVITGRRSA
jgi:hypothetical protein